MPEIPTHHVLRKLPSLPALTVKGPDDLGVITLFLRRNVLWGKGLRRFVVRSRFVGA